MDPETTSSHLTRQPSGIRALPSHDNDDFIDTDDDDFDIHPDPVYENPHFTREFPDFTEKIETLSSNSASISSSMSSSDTSSNAEEFEDSGIDPDVDLVENEVGSHQNHGLGFGLNAGVPVAKVSGEDDDDDDEDQEEEGEAPRARVLEDGDEEVEWDEPFEGPELETLDIDEVEVSGSDAVGVDDNKGRKVEGVGWETRDIDEGEVSGSGGVVDKKGEAVVGEKYIDDSGMALTNEDDSVLDSANVDVVESMGVVAEGKETSVVEESVSGGSEGTEAGGVKYTGEGDAIVESINVDADEAARSSVAIVGEVKGSDDEDIAPVHQDSIAGKDAAEDPTAIETDDTKSVVESNSVVDAIEVNVVEAISSGVAVVRESVFEGTELETKEVEAPVVENLTLANEFAQLSDTISSEIVERPDDGLEDAQTNDANASSSEMQSGRENEKVQPSQVDGEPGANSVRVEGEKGSQPSYVSVLVDEVEVPASDRDQLEQTKICNPGTRVDADDGFHVAHGKKDDGSVDRAKIINDLVVTDSDGNGSDQEGSTNDRFDSAALTSLLKAVTGAGNDPGTVTVKSQDGFGLLSMERPAGLDALAQSARPGAGSTNSSFFSPTNSAPLLEDNLSDEDKKKLKILQQLKVKFLRLVQRVGLTPENALAAQLLYNLSVLAGRTVSPAFGLDIAKQTAMQLEVEGKDDLDFSMNILILGKTGVGKSAIINSIFGEDKVKINAFEPETTSVNVVFGTVDGVKIRFIDAPGLKSSAMDQRFNCKVLASVKKHTKKYPPDIMFYVDRLDSQTRNLNDMPMLKTISNSLGTSIWRKAIITLTHASSAPPDGPSGNPLNYEVFVTQRSRIIHQSIGQAVGDLRLLNMMPTSLVENHPACQKNLDGHKILPNGQAWRQQLLLLCYSVKVLSEASVTASKSQDAFDMRKLFGFHVRSPPLPYLLSSLLQPRAYPKISPDQGGDNIDSDIDLDDASDSDQEEEDEYDQLPPFKPLKKSQMAKLSSDQKKAYFEEYDYRVKLLQRKQWRAELKRIREAKSGKNVTDDMPEDYDGENGAPAAIPVPLPDMTLPPSFDSDNPAYRYRFLEPSSQFLARPVLDPHGWDHDCGYEGVNVEHTVGIAERFPASFTVQVNKDKKDFNVHLDSSLSAKHGENGSSLLGFDVQTIGKQYAYIVRGETKFKNSKKNKTAAGVTVTFLGENVATGVKLEDQIILGKRLVLVGSTGTVRSNKDGAYGANLEVRLRDADYPVAQEQSSFTLSLMKWKGDLAVGANLQSQVSVGPNSKVAIRAALNNKMSGQITLRTSSSDHLSLALAGLMPIATAIYQKLRPRSPGNIKENYAIY